LAYAFIVELATFALLCIRTAQIVCGAEFDWLRAAVPPVVDLFFLAVVVFFSMSTFTIWRKTETDPKRHLRRRAALVMLGIIWVLFTLTMYITSILNLLGIAA
jgi:hypothetical protein